MKTELFRQHGTKEQPKRFARRPPKPQPSRESKIAHLKRFRTIVSTVTMAVSGYCAMPTAVHDEGAKPGAIEVGNTGKDK